MRTFKGTQIGEIGEIGEAQSELSHIPSPLPRMVYPISVASSPIYLPPFPISLAPGEGCPAAFDLRGLMVLPTVCYAWMHSFIFHLCVFMCCSHASHQSLSFLIQAPWQVMGMYLILALGCAPLGALLVVRRMTLMADGMVHAMFPGMAIGYVLDPSGSWISGILGLTSSVFLGTGAWFMSGRTLVDPQSIFAGLSIAAMILGLFVLGQQDPHHLLRILIREPVLCTPYEWLGLILLVGITWSFVLKFGRLLVLESFDPVFMRIHSCSLTWVQRGLWLLMALYLWVVLQFIGTLMALGLVVLPALTIMMCVRTWTHVLVGISCITTSAVLLGSVISMISGIGLVQAIMGILVIIYIGTLMWRGLGLYRIVE